MLLPFVGVAGATGAGVTGAGAGAGVDGVGGFVSGANNDGSEDPACGFADAETSPAPGAEATTSFGPGRTNHIPSAINIAVATVAAPAQISGVLLRATTCSIDIPGCPIDIDGAWMAGAPIVETGVRCEDDPGTGPGP